jgi:hypothetical protein
MVSISSRDRIRTSDISLSAAANKNDSRGRGYRPPGTMTTTYLNVCTYDAENPLGQGDQILVPSRVWTAFDEDHEGTGPIFVSLGDGVIGRLRPATPADHLDEDSCRVPLADWIRLGAPLIGERWITLEPLTLPAVGSITLRARREAYFTALADPVATLSAEISAIWACISNGAELALPCGVFDVMDLCDLSGSTIPAGCLLDTDVNLEIVPALDAAPPTPQQRPLTPHPSPFTTPVYGSSSSSNAVDQLPFLNQPPPDPRFPGRGYRLGDK